jgi:hypothetical protein
MTKSDMAGLPDEFEKRLMSLLGKVCWNISAAGSAGGHDCAFRLALGEKILKRRPLIEPSSTEEIRSYVSECTLFVTCRWRLDGPTGPLSSSSEHREAQAQCLEETLVGKRVRSVRCLSPAWDLSIEFTGNSILHIFCVLIGPDPLENWWLRMEFGQIMMLAGPGYHRTLKDESEPKPLIM